MHLRSSKHSMPLGIEYSLRQYLVPPLFSIVYLYPHARIQVSRGPVKLHVKTLRLYLPGFSISWSLNVYVILHIMLSSSPVTKHDPLPPGATRTATQPGILQERAKKTANCQILRASALAQRLGYDQTRRVAKCGYKSGIKPTLFSGNGFEPWPNPFSIFAFHVFSETFRTTSNDSAT